MSGQGGAAPQVHLVGSLPCADAEAAFRTVAGRLGPHLRRLPDGETGKRARWVGFVHDKLCANPALEVDHSIPPFPFRQWDGRILWEIQRLKFRHDVDPKGVGFDTGYADDAIRSFAVFDRLQREGAIPKGVRFQVSIASPLAVTYMYLAPRARDAFTAVYRDHLEAEVAKICAAIPHDRLAVQWDVCQEVLAWEGYYDDDGDVKGRALAVLGHVGDAVPEGVDLGYHLCYGSPKDEHLVQPKDMGVLVEIANGIGRAVRRPVAYIHMPVPKTRNDEDYFRPLAALALPQGAALYLGLVHDGDAAGSAAKLALARKYADVAGIAAECGLGRGDPARLASVLETHAACVHAAAAS
jgi:hypothetical protein